MNHKRNSKDYEYEKYFQDISEIYQLIIPDINAKFQ